MFVVISIAPVILIASGSGVQSEFSRNNVRVALQWLERTYVDLVTVSDEHNDEHKRVALVFVGGSLDATI